MVVTRIMQSIIQTTVFDSFLQISKKIGEPTIHFNDVLIAGKKLLTDHHHCCCVYP